MRKLLKIILMTAVLSALTACSEVPKDDSSSSGKNRESKSAESSVSVIDREYSDNILLSINNGAAGFGTIEECTDATIYIYTDKTVRVFMDTDDYPEIAAFELSDDEYEEIEEVADRDKIYSLEVENDEDACDGSSYNISLYDKNDERLIYKGGYMPLGDDFWEIYNGIQDILRPYDIGGIVDDYREIMAQNE